MGQSSSLGLHAPEISRSLPPGHLSMKPEQGPSSLSLQRLPLRVGSRRRGGCHSQDSLEAELWGEEGARPHFHGSSESHATHAHIHTVIPCHDLELGLHPGYVTLPCLASPSPHRGCSCVPGLVLGAGEPGASQEKNRRWDVFPGAGGAGRGKPRLGVSRPGWPCHQSR